jgi:hypothetical protein
MKQTPFASVSYNAKNKQTRRERFLLGDGAGGALGGPVGRGQAVLFEVRSARASADALEHDAADSLFATVVRSV